MEKWKSTGKTVNALIWVLRKRHVKTPGRGGSVLYFLLAGFWQDVQSVSLHCVVALPTMEHAP